MAVVDPLRQTGGPGRVERRGPRVLVEHRERKRRIRALEHRLVLGGECKLARRDRRTVDEQHELHVRPDLGVNLLEQRQELGVDEDHVVGGVIDRVEHLLRRNAHVYRVQHRAHHRHREEAFEVAVAVPVHHRDGGARRDAKTGERGREAAHAFGERRVGMTAGVGVDDLLRRRPGHAVGEDLTDRKRGVAGRGRARDGEFFHAFLLDDEDASSRAGDGVPGYRPQAPSATIRRDAPIPRRG